MGPYLQTALVLLHYCVHFLISASSAVVEDRQLPPKAVAALRSCDCTLLAWVHGNGAGERLQTTGAWPVTDAVEGEEGSSRVGNTDLLQRLGIAQK